MTIIKKDKTYSVKERKNHWNVEKKLSSLFVRLKIEKSLCGTFEELENYVKNNDMFQEEAMEKRKMTPQERYAKKYKKQFKIDLITRTEQDIIDKLESVPNKAGYIKRLIRADIAADKEKK